MTAASSTFDSTLAFYRDNAKKFVSSTAELDLHELYEPFLSHLKPGTHILDAGCGSGRDGAAFVARGYEVTAIDASPAMVSAASDRGLKAQLFSFQQMTWRAEFDGIWACASLLHVPRAEMTSVLAQLARALKPEGILYVSLKEGDGERTLSDGRFFSYFHREEFEALLTTDGKFVPLEFWLTHAGDSSGNEWPWMNFLSQKVSCFL